VVHGLLRAVLQKRRNQWVHAMFGRDESPLIFFLFFTIVVVHMYVLHLLRRCVVFELDVQVMHGRGMLRKEG
jgi:hypothetical protein